jgi:peptidoglycan-associated lipoprotein
MEVFRMKRFFLVTALFLTFVAGCATEQKVTAPDDKQTAKVSDEKAADQGSIDVGKKESVGSEDASLDRTGKKTGELTDEQLRAALSDILKDVHFDYDRYEIKDADKAALKTLSDWMLAHKGAKVLIEGHCDDRGSNEYNLGLGDQRAQAARNYLNTLGVSSDQMETVSYGEEKPLCAEHNETCWSSNRRAHFVLTK